MTFQKIWRTFDGNSTIIVDFSENSTKNRRKLNYPLNIHISISIYPWMFLRICINNCEFNDGWGPHENSPNLLAPYSLAPHAQTAVPPWGGLDTSQYGFPIGPILAPRAQSPFQGWWWICAWAYRRARQDPCRAAQQHAECCPQAVHISRLITAGIFKSPTTSKSPNIQINVQLIKSPPPTSNCD